MRCGKWTLSSIAGCCVLVTLSGCVSLGDHQRLKASMRNLRAQQEVLQQELFDVRNNANSLRTRAGSLERELSTSSELLANLRKENSLLDEVMRRAQNELEKMANSQQLGDISITGPKLPEPLHQALRQFADAHPGEVVYDAGRGNVKWKADLLFALGSDVVKQSSLESLRGFAQVIMSPAADDFEALIVGHTDNTPIVRLETKAKHPSNWHLSAHRAISVATVLQKYGYASERIGVMGLGEFRPIADNGSPTGKSQNRRVEIFLVPRGVLIASARAEASREPKMAGTVKP